jgi:2-iminobutanoate/2-iminopropanoate deaminase
MEKISTSDAPAAAGPYSQAIKHNGIVYTAGQLGIDPKAGKLVDGGIAEQTEQVLKNLKAVLETAGSSMDNALKVNVFITDIKDFKAMNEVYARYFTNAPARATVEVSGLVLGAVVEIDVVAYCDK